MKTGQRGVEPAPARLDEVAELVHEDQEHEADRELPAPEQRIAADRDEDRRELREREAELDDQPERRPRSAPRSSAPATATPAPGGSAGSRARGSRAGSPCLYGIETGRPSASSSGAEKTQSTWMLASLSPP